MDNKTKFLNIYANLPLSTRNEIVVVIGNEPLTWNAAKLEIEQDELTPKAEQILDILVSLKIIQ